MIIPAVFDQNWPSGYGADVVKSFFYIKPWRHLVQRSATIWAILVEGHKTIIPVKLYQNRPSGYRDVVFKLFFLF